MDTWDAIVVGGGFAGVMAARELSEAGLTVLLLEGRDRLGGRTACREFTGTTARIELGGTYLDDTQTHIQRETQRYGLELTYPPQAERTIWNLDGRQWEASFPLPWEEGVTAEQALSQLRAAAARIELDRPHTHQDINDLDVSVGELIDRLGVGPVTRDLLLSWASLYTGVSEHEASALYHLHSIATLGGSPVALAPSLVITEGTSGLIGSIAGDFRGEIRLSTTVRSITHTDTGVTVETTTGDVLQARRAVVALPVNVLSDLTFEPQLDAGKQELAQEGHAGRGFKFFALVENVPDNIQAVGWGQEGEVVWLSTAQRIGDRNLLVGFSNPAENFSPFDLQDVQKAVASYLPEARVVAVDGHDWNADQFSRGTWMVPKPGQMTALSTAHNLDEGRLHFAGADFSLRWFSWIEGALETGHQAAHRLIEALHAEQTIPVLAGQSATPRTI